MPPELALPGAVTIINCDVDAQSVPLPLITIEHDQTREGDGNFEGVAVRRATLAHEGARRQRWWLVKVAGIATVTGGRGRGDEHAAGYAGPWSPLEFRCPEIQTQLDAVLDPRRRVRRGNDLFVTDVYDDLEVRGIVGETDLKVSVLGACPAIVAGMTQGVSVTVYN